MKAERLVSRPNVLVITNYEQIDEKDLYRQVKELLGQNALVSWGKEANGPSEDVQYGEIDGFPFSLICDMDYGTEICSELNEAIEKLIKAFR